MLKDDFPEFIRPYIVPTPSGDPVYRCLECNREFPIDELLYTCPECRGLFLIVDKEFARLTEISGELWRRIFDYRRMLNHPGVKGVFTFHELVAPMVDIEDVVYLGEGHTPVVRGNSALQELCGADFYFKNDGQNPSASFKDRGMAAALTYINFMIRHKGLKQVLAICASTGDTSAAAALYSAYLRGPVSAAVLLPQGKVTPQQMAQPLGSGAAVLEIPGVFDDCMKVVEELADDYHVALLNSKNAWRIKGQETYSYEIAQEFEYQVKNLVVVLPIGNAGNITAVMQGFLTFQDLGVIDKLPKIIGVQSQHADPVYRYYLEPDPQKRRFSPVNVSPSVAQAAMIGNPVSFPRVKLLADEYNSRAGDRRIFVVQVTEQEIMDHMMIANRNGNIVCTQGGESLAGFRAAVKQGIVAPDEVGVLDSTAHHLKFIGFQEYYFSDSFPPEYEVKPRAELKNRPRLVAPDKDVKLPQPGRTMDREDFDRFVKAEAELIAGILDLKKK